MTILSYASSENITWERKTICPQANFASKISAPSLSKKEQQLRCFNPFYTFCGGSVWALPSQVLKLCEPIQHDVRNSLPIMYMPREMYCYPSSRVNEHLMRHLKHYYMMKKKNKSMVKDISNTSLCLICSVTKNLE